MKHWEHTLATYVYNHCNICNILIYFCNIHMKHLKHISETTKTLKTYACNMSENAWNTTSPTAMAYLVGNYGNPQARVRRMSRTMAQHTPPLHDFLSYRGVFCWPLEMMSRPTMTSYLWCRDSGGLVTMAATDEGEWWKPLFGFG
jgi:hypothetical protein